LDQRKTPLAKSPDGFMREIVLESEVMRSIMKVALEVARYDVNVLIHGESGTGKELLAKYIHLNSPRSQNPFIPVNCGVLSGLMFEDKLFGHEKGSFTGAISRKKGCFEMADRGTLFLDEVSEIPLENQVDFLRVLEDFRFTRIGGNELLQVKVRIISATNKDLREQVRQGLFREDLFYRLQVVPIALPPLRDRREEIPKMVDHFLSELSLAHRKYKPILSQEVLDIFRHYDWPGNVRELKNIVERIFIVNHEKVITEGQLPSDFVWHFNEPARSLKLEEARQEVERKTLVNVLYRVQGDREKAAELLAISPRTLRYKLQQYGIKINRRGDPVYTGSPGRSTKNGYPPNWR
jgi:two-component system, NtrC family, response regulator AtoC